MDEQKKPRAREKRVAEGGKGVQKQGEGLGTGPLNNTGSYADRPVGGTAGTRPAASSSPQKASAPQGTARPAGTAGGRPAQPARPQSSPFAAPHSSGSRPSQSARPQGTPAAKPQANGSQRASSAPQSTQRAGAASGGSGCSTKLLPLILLLAVLLGGGKLTGLFDGGDTSSLPAVGTTTQTQVQTQSQTQTQSQSSSGFGSTSSSFNSGSTYSSASGLTDLLSAFLSSSGSSVYDYTGSSSSLGGSAVSSLLSSSGLGGSSSSVSSAQLDTTVASSARAKYTTLKGNKKDTVTLMVYMCGTDLESQNGMGTADLKEMCAAALGDNVNLIVYTGGCRRWKNNVVSSSVNQIYQIKDGGLYCLEKDMGSASMTAPATLSNFIQYGAKNFPANRMCLIFWDHGGGSVSGFGYDEKNSSSGSMSLAGINTALKSGGVKFDFIGFDACLMATVENGLMLNNYADYMIASEESEPGVGWYYTNWLTNLGKNPSLSTLEIGKQISDDFVEVCNRQCRGQATTLSVVDLAELSATVPSALKAFSTDTSALIKNNEYSRVSSARSKTREFAQSSRIDQVDLVHFARNLGSSDGEKLAKALEGAVKYNRTGGGMTNAYGLSIYFPYKRAAKVNQMVSTYTAIGMDEEYARCIQAFASLEVSGQVAAGTPVSSYGMSGYGSGYGSSGSSLPGLMDILTGGSSASSGYSSGSSYGSSADLTDLLGGLFSDSSSGSLFDLFSGRSLSAEETAQYLSTHHLDASSLVWDGNRIHLDQAQWSEIADIALNVFVDDGAGYIDLGMDNLFAIEGNDLVGDFDNTWISIDGQPIAYYYLGTAEGEGEEYLISGYTPAMLNGNRVNLLLYFDHERPYGYIAGAEPVYTAGETEAQAKNLIQIGEGDTLQFLCDYFDYEGNYLDSYRLGEPLTLGAEVEIANTDIGSSPTVATYRITDLYQQNWWTPALKAAAAE